VMANWGATSRYGSTLFGKMTRRRISPSRVTGMQRKSRQDAVSKFEFGTAS